MTFWAVNREEHATWHPGVDPDYLDRRKRGVKLLSQIKRESKRSLPSVNLQMPLNRLNFTNIGERVDLAIESGCDSVTFGFFRDWGGQFENYCLLPEDGGALRKELLLAKRRFEAGGIKHNVDRYLARVELGSDAWRKVPCYAGWFQSYIKVDGSVMPCCPCSQVMGNLRERSFCGDLEWNRVPGIPPTERESATARSPPPALQLLELLSVAGQCPRASGVPLAQTHGEACGYGGAGMIAKLAQAASALATRRISFELDLIPLRFEALPLKKIVNWILTEGSVAFKPAKPWGFPTVLQIEPTSRCNLQCKVCPVAAGLDRPAGDMDLQMFRRIVDELGDYLLLMMFWDWGEPFLNPHSYEMIQIRAQRRHQSCLQHQRAPVRESRARAPGCGVRPGRAGVLGRRHHAGDLSALPRAGQARERSRRNPERGGREAPPRLGYSLGELPLHCHAAQRARNLPSGGFCSVGWGWMS